MDNVKKALSDVIEARRLDLAAREDVRRTWSKKLNEAQGMLASAQKEETQAREDLRQVCMAYFPLVMGKVSDNPCKPYAAEYQRMMRKGSELDRT